MYAILMHWHKAISTGSSDAKSLTIEFNVHDQNFIIFNINMQLRWQIKKQQNKNKSYNKSMHFYP
jgi:hypothetical protein